MSGNTSDRRDYDIAASTNAQDNFHAVAARLDTLIDQRTADVRAAMADYQADGVSEDYAVKEQRWSAAATGVKGIISTLRTAMAANDETAQATLTRARAAVSAMG